MIQLNVLCIRHNIQRDQRQVDDERVLMMLMCLSSKTNEKRIYASAHTATANNTTQY